MTLWSLPGSSVHGILQARILDWVTISWDLPDPGIKPQSPTLEADTLTFEPPGKPIYVCVCVCVCVCIYIIESVCCMPETNAAFKPTILQQQQQKKTKALLSTHFCGLSCNRSLKFWKSFGDGICMLMIKPLQGYGCHIAWYCSCLDISVSSTTFKNTNYVLIKLVLNSGDSR